MKPLKLFATVVSQAVCLHSYFCFIHSAWAEQPHYDHRQPSFAIHAAAAARERFVELWFCFQQFLFAGQQCASESGLFTFRCLHFCVLSLSFFLSGLGAVCLLLTLSIDMTTISRWSAVQTSPQSLAWNDEKLVISSQLLMRFICAEKKTDWLMSSSSSCLVVCPSPSLTSFT